MFIVIKKERERERERRRRIFDATCVGYRVADFLALDCSKRE